MLQTLTNTLRNGSNTPHAEYRALFSRRLEFKLLNLASRQSGRGSAHDVPAQMDIYHQQLEPIQNFLSTAQHRLPGFLLSSSKDSKVREQETLSFADSFAEFIDHIDGDMVQLEVAVMKQPDSEKRFRPGWQSRIRNAAYLAFVSHYGQMRKGEKDQQGKPLQYIEHPRRAAFDAMIHKVGLIDEETFVATLLHDAKEDVSKSIFVQHAGAKKEQALDLIQNFVASEHVQVRSGADAIDINKLLDYLDKNHAHDILGREANRTEALMCMLHQFAIMSDEDFLKYGVRTLLVKISDRIDNDATIEKLDPDRFTAIWLETCYFYLSLTRALHMRNCEEWFYDLIERVKSDERSRHQFRRLEDQRIHDLPAQFVERIYAEIERDGFSRDELTIIFRPRGIRFMQDREISLESGTAQTNSLRFNNFVNFIPVSKDPERNKKLVMIMQVVLRRLFPHQVPPSQFREASTRFGEKYQYLSDFPLSAALADSGVYPAASARTPNSSLKELYGTAGFRIFENYERFCADYYGKPHMALILGDASAEEDLFNLRDNLRSYSSSLLDVLKKIDTLSVPDKDLEGVKGWIRQKYEAVMTAFRKPLSSSPSPDTQLYTVAQRNSLRDLVYAFFYNIVLAKKWQATVVDHTSGSPNEDEFMPTYGPQGLRFIAGLVPHDITLLTKLPLSVSVEVPPGEEDGGKGRKRRHPLRVTDFSHLRTPAELQVTPYGSAVNKDRGVLHVTNDSTVSDFRLAHFALAELNRGLAARRDGIRLDGQIKQFPERILTVGDNTTGSLR